MGKELLESSIEKILFEELDAAKETLHAFLQSEPKNYEAYGYLAFCYSFDLAKLELYETHRNKFVEYGSELELALVAFLDEAIENVRNGELNGRYDALIKQLDNHTDLSNKPVDVNLLLTWGVLTFSAHHLSDNNQFEDAISLLEKIKPPQQQPIFEQMRRLFIAETYVLGRMSAMYPTAIVTFTQAFDAYPKLPILFRLHWAHALGGLEQWDMALTQLKIIAKQLFDTDRLHTNKVIKYFKILFDEFLNNPTCHLFVIEKLLPTIKDSMHPEYALFWEIYINRMLLQNARNHEVHTIIDSLLSLYPNYPIFYRQKGSLFLAEKNYTEAEAWYAKAIAASYNAGTKKFLAKAVPRWFQENFIYFMVILRCPEIGLESISFNDGLFWEGDREIYKSITKPIRFTANQICNLREQRDEACLNAKSPIQYLWQYNYYTAEIKQEFSKIGLSNYHEPAKPFPTLVNLAAFFVKNLPAEKRKGLVSCPPEVQERVNQFS